MCPFVMLNFITYALLKYRSVVAVSFWFSKLCHLCHFGMSNLGPFEILIFATYVLLKYQTSLLTPFWLRRKSLNMKIQLPCLTFRGRFFVLIIIYSSRLLSFMFICLHLIFIFNNTLHSNLFNFILPYSKFFQ